MNYVNPKKEEKDSLHFKAARRRSLLIIMYCLLLTKPIQEEKKLVPVKG